MDSLASYGVEPLGALTALTSPLTDLGVTPLVHSGNIDLILPTALSGLFVGVALIILAMIRVVLEGDR